MWRVLSLVTFAALLSVTALAQSRPPLTDGDIDQLLTLGRAGSFGALTDHCTAVRTSGLAGIGGLAGMAVQGIANRGTDKYIVTAMGPRGWIARAVWLSAKSGKPLERVDIPAAWRQQALYVVVEPDIPKPDSEAEPTIPSAVTAVRLKSVPVSQSQPNIDLKPIGNLTFINRNWKNTAGASVDYREATTEFDGVAATGFDGDFVSVTVTSEGGSRSCDLSARSLSKFGKEGGRSDAGAQSVLFVAFGLRHKARIRSPISSFTLGEPTEPPARPRSVQIPMETTDRGMPGRAARRAP